MYDYGPMMADMAEKQLAAEDTSAYSLVNLRCDLVKAQSELTACKEELVRVNHELERTREDAAKESAEASRLARRAFAVAVISCIASVVVPFIVLALK